MTIVFFTFQIDSLLQKDNILLIFPPVWLPESPFLSTPILTAYLKQRGLTVFQRDLNVEFWNHFYDETKLEELFEDIQDTWEWLVNKKDFNYQDEKILTMLGGIIKLSKKRFIYEITHSVIEKSFLRQLIQNVSKFRLNLRSPSPNSFDVEKEFPYHDLLFSDISMSFLAQSSNDIISFLNQNITNPYSEYYEKYIIESILVLNPKVIGISITAINQVIPAFILAKILKAKCPQSHITIGGAWCTQTNQNLIKVIDKFTFIDSMIIYEGEEPFYLLCKTVIEKNPLSNIPNIILNNGNKRLLLTKIYTARMNDLPTPDYSDLLQNNYDSPKSFSLQSSRGCYWGKCTFCSYPILESIYKTRSVEKIGDDIFQLVKQYGAKEIAFTDALLSPSYCRQLSLELIKRKIKINWLIFARFEKQFTSELLDLMAKAGCVHVSWGLESANQRILKLIDKNISLDKASEILSLAAENNIHNRVLVMYGHPTETYTEANETIDFIKSHKSTIHSIAYGYYNPEEGTPIEEIALKLGITLKRKNNKDLSFSYEWDSFLTLFEKEIIENAYSDLSVIITQNQNNNHSTLDNFILKDYVNNEIEFCDFSVEIPSMHGAKKTVISKLISDKRKYFIKTQY